MNHRLKILEKHNLKLPDIQEVIRKIEPLEGAAAFLDWIRSHHQIIIVSDTFVEFAGPLMRKLGRPTLFCNRLEVGPDHAIIGYRLRQKDGKRKVVQALKTLQYRVIAFGDSYNDITMLKEADAAFLFRPPENVANEFPDILATHSYDELRQWLINAVEH